ncbi:MAG: NADH-quinone oxidoreductase subunit C [Firmicutes bacterium]|nr:NADH-quinone oxidoreductase subunit C [Bacillota bacterium]
MTRREEEMSEKRKKHKAEDSGDDVPRDAHEKPADPSGAERGTVSKAHDREAESALKPSADKAAKAAAAAKARAADVKKKPKEKKKEEPPEPSPQQPLLDSFVQVIREKAGEGAVETSFINRKDGHRPTIVVPANQWASVAHLLAEEAQLAFDYLQNLSGVDYEDYLEVVIHLTSLKHGHSLCVKVKTDREEAQVPSVAKVWPAADWHEREVFDLMGIRFVGHPELKRILMPDHWVGHPLRKDYVPYDQEI